MRDVDSAIIDALNAGAIKQRKFYTITAPRFSDGVFETACFWSDLGPITLAVLDGITGSPDTRTFLGSGTLVNSTAIPLTSDLSVRSVTITLNQTDDRVDTLVRGYKLRNAYCEVHGGLFNTATHVIVSDPVCDFAGFVDGCTIKSPAAGQTGEVELRLVSHTREATRAGNQNRSHVDQQLRNPSDDLLKFASIMGSVPIYWYTAKLIPSGAAHPSSTQSVNSNTRVGRLTGGLT